MVWAGAQHSRTVGLGLVLGGVFPVFQVIRGACPHDPYVKTVGAGGWSSASEHALLVTKASVGKDTVPSPSASHECLSTLSIETDNTAGLLMPFGAWDVVHWISSPSP